MLDKAGIAYTTIDAEQNKDKSVEFNVKTLPVMFVPIEGKYERYSNPTEIKKFIECRKV